MNNTPCQAVAPDQISTTAARIYSNAGEALCRVHVIYQKLFPSRPAPSDKGGNANTPSCIEEVLEAAAHDTESLIAELGMIADRL